MFLPSIAVSIKTCDTQLQLIKQTKAASGEGARHKLDTPVTRTVLHKLVIAPTITQG